VRFNSLILIAETNAAFVKIPGCSPLHICSSVADRLRHVEIAARIVDHRPAASLPKTAPSNQGTTSRRRRELVPWTVGAVLPGASCRGGDQRCGRQFRRDGDDPRTGRANVEAANNLEFEKAALFRDQIKELKRSLNDERDENAAKPSAMRL